MSKRSPVDQLTDFAVRQSLLSDGLQSKLDWGFFVLATGAAVWLGWLLLGLGLKPGPWQIPLWILFWAALAYLVLPRIHRILTSIYVPNYFIGRARTSDGLLGDPVNLAFRGSEEQLHTVMQAAGWTLADPVSWRSSWRIITSTVLRRSYDEAPVSPLLLFGRQQDLAYQQEVDGSPGKRHHVRFWRAPEGWMLPGGSAVDWLAAGTYDRKVGLSLFTLQVTHKIAPNVDDERDHIVASVQGAEPAVTVEVLKDFATGYHSRNGGGDNIQTDGDLPIVNLRAVPASQVDDAIATTHTIQRPLPIVLGAALIWLSALGAVISAINLFANSDTLTNEIDGSATARAVVLGFASLFAILSLLKGWLAYLVLLGSSWARTLVLSLLVITLLSQLLLLQNSNTDMFEFTTAFGTALDILTMLALSSEGAAGYVRRCRERLLAQQPQRS